MERLNATARRVTIADPSQIPEARRAAQTLARNIGFDETKAGRVAIVVTEAATNLLKHAGRGEILLQMVEDRNRGRGVEMLALDKGPGMANVGESLRDGYSTAGSAGTGLGAICRLVDFFDIYSRPGMGTAILARFRTGEGVADGSFETGGISVAVEGEQACGDAWSYRITPGGLSGFVADGLGHGMLAEDAARGAVRAYEGNPGATTVELLDRVHQATRGTRGAAVAVANIDTASRLVRFAGIGNIAGVLTGPGGTRHMVSMSGIIGHQVRAFREFTYPWEAGCLMVLHSDGLGTRWDLASYPGLTHRSCGLIAGVLWRDMVRSRDDSTVVVTRQTGT
ncbi:MAG: ATP-binding SpoIIE family protein phosphatase [Acidobacteriota bacterium]